ncbi:MAG: Uma2 family endonuclease [Saprospiraceae bacterium]|jgi:Uma2 family endonuclease|nr:Uma2 family endonuclease [Saprospiraceae bacterium]
MLDNTIYLGVNAPKPHQRIIGKLMMRLGNLFYDEQRIPYEPFPETMIDEDQTSPTPDVLLFDNETHQNKVIIEVCGNTGFKRDFEKVKELVETYGVPEGFVYNYQAKTWHKYALGKGEDFQQPSFSNLLNYDLMDLLK